MLTNLLKAWTEPLHSACLRSAYVGVADRGLRHVFKYAEGAVCTCVWLWSLSPALPGEEVTEQSSNICDDRKVSWDKETAATYTTSLVHLSLRTSCGCSLFSECCCFSVQYMSSLRGSMIFWSDSIRTIE